MKVLLIENWGLGDAVLMTTALQAARAAGHDVICLVKPASAALLRPSYPDVLFVEFIWPWTAFRGKYRLWEWPWGGMNAVVGRLRALSFDAVVSVRPDPRDHLLMFLTGARRRVGFPRAGGGLFLTERVRRAPGIEHRVDAWRRLSEQLIGSHPGEVAPRLFGTRYASVRVEGVLDRLGPPWLVVHCGAGQPVRRWPVVYLAETIRRCRDTHRLRVAVIPDRDGYGSELEPLADALVRPSDTDELVVALRQACAVIAPDSGPAHIAAALGVPVCAIFGPQDPRWFAPYGAANLAVTREGPCVFRPCSDSCRYAEPTCLTEFRAEAAWPAIAAWLAGVLGPSSAGGFRP
jgi:ADP-heptose:LPS heptosyltransferase